MPPRRAWLIGALAWSATARFGRAQPPATIPRIGYVNLRAREGPPDLAFAEGLHQHGYAAGRDVTIEYRWADGDIAKLEAQVGELVRLPVDVIVTAATYPTRAAMRATSAIPIVMAASADPVSAGLVASLDRPGGNVTGMSLLTNDLAQKRLQLARELVPGLRTVAVIAYRLPSHAGSPEHDPTGILIDQTTRVAGPIGIAVRGAVVAGIGELRGAVAGLKRAGVGLAIVQVSPLTLLHRDAIVAAAEHERLPAIYEERSFVDAGGFISYGPDLRDSYRRAAAFVARILKGAQPADLPIEQPTKLELVVNLRAASALGLSIPQAIAARADEVIR